MAATSLEICKLALARIGNTNFFMTFTDGSVEANVCNLEYPQVRDMTLERLDPPFATKRVSLNALTDVNSNWDFVYALPVDFISIQEIVSPYGRFIPKDLKDKFDIETGSTGLRVLLCNTADVEIIYTYRHDVPSVWTPSFTEAVITGMMSRLALSIKKDFTMAMKLEQEYDTKTARANTSAETQRQYGEEYVSSILRSRY